MKCTDFENRLNELLDDRRAPQDDALLQAHAESCGDCREMLLAQESLFRGIALLQRRTPAPELGKRVLRELTAPVATLPPLPSPPRRRWWPMLVSAAAVLFAVGFSIWLAGRGNNGPQLVQPRGAGARPEGLAIGNRNLTKPKSINESVSPVPSIAPPQKAIVEQHPVPPARALTPEESEAYRQAMASLASTWSTSAQWPQIESIEAINIESINMEQYAPGIRPIRESFEVAVEALLKTIPSGKKENRPGQPQALQPYGGMTDIA